jgi:hypothetical protein
MNALSPWHGLRIEILTYSIVHFSLVDFSLRIRSIQVSDGGDYTCYISTNGPPVSVTHNLQILGNRFLLHLLHQHKRASRLRHP